MARVLWLGDAGCHTGFARVTHAIGERLVEDYGHDVSVLAPNYQGDFWPGLRDPDRQPLKLYVTQGPQEGIDIYGAKRIPELLLRLRPEVVVTLNDPWVFLKLLGNNSHDPNKVLLRAQPHVYYAPCDGTNLPPTWTELIPQVSQVMAMSKWAQQHYGGTLAYHGVDQNDWWPVEERPITVSTGQVLRTKQDCKKAFGYDPKDFLIGRVDTNSGRKDYAATWKAVVPLMKKHKRVKAHFHVTNRQNPGVDFVQLFSREPDLENDRFFVPAMKGEFRGWPQQDMNALVNAFDVVLNTSRGEGFGFSNAEAAACGVPVIAQNVSAIPEVVGPGGILIEPERLITVPNGEDNWLADIPAFTEALMDLFDSPSKRRELGRKGVEHVRASFSWDATTALFHTAIENDAAKYRDAMDEAARAAAAEGVEA